MIIPKQKIQVFIMLIESAGLAEAYVFEDEDISRSRARSRNGHQKTQWSK
jgi:hypothetical protein